MALRINFLLKMSIKNEYSQHFEHLLTASEGLRSNA